MRTTPPPEADALAVAPTHSPQSEAIFGLPLTSANYQEAIDILRKRFSNKQLFINCHMEALLKLPPIASQTNLKSIRHFFDTVESHVRSLKSLGVPTESYGSLLSSIIMGKLPSELRLMVSREVKEGEWELDSPLKTVEYELDARERSAGSTTLAGGSTQHLFTIRSKSSSRGEF